MQTRVGLDQSVKEWEHALSFIKGRTIAEGQAGRRDTQGKPWPKQNLKGESLKQVFSGACWDWGQVSWMQTLLQAWAGRV